MPEIALVSNIRVADIVVPHDRMRRLRPEVVDELAELIGRAV